MDRLRAIAVTGALSSHQMRAAGRLPRHTASHAAHPLTLASFLKVHRVPVRHMASGFCSSCSARSARSWGVEARRPF